MIYLLDTNVISEWRQNPMDQNVRNWVAGVFEDDLALSVVSIAEIRSGIARLPTGKRRSAMEAWLDQDVRARFRGRILGIDEDVADMCGQLLGLRHLTPAVRRIMDFWLASIAKHQSLTLVTRNVRDFQDLDVKIINPWTEAP